MAQANADLEQLVGKTFDGRYRLDKLLGAGGMGAVYRAHHLGLQQDVALKVLRPNLAGGHNATARFQREARSASRLDHPNCVRVTDFGELDNGTKYLVMQLLEGSELEAKLGEPWVPREAIDASLQIFDALDHAHSQGIVHRDLKPENVFVTRDHRGQELLKLVDFGIAKIVEGEGSSDKLTQTGLIFGTPSYMSPEQAAGGKIDARTDLYAVGLILYEMLAGHPTFEADELQMLLRMHILRDPPSLPESVPGPLSDFVMKLLEKSREDRYASAADAMLALREIAAGLDAGAGAPVSAMAQTAGLVAGMPTVAEVSGSKSAPPVWREAAGGAPAHTMPYVSSEHDNPISGATMPLVESSMSAHAHSHATGAVTMPPPAAGERDGDRMPIWAIGLAAFVMLLFLSCGIAGLQHWGDQKAVVGGEADGSDTGVPADLGVGATEEAGAGQDASEEGAGGAPQRSADERKASEDEEEGDEDDEEEDEKWEKEKAKWEEKDAKKKSKKNKKDDKKSKKEDKKGKG